MSISEQVKELRDKAYIFEKSGCAVDGIVRVFNESADTIESLSAKLQAANMERSADCGEELSKAKEVIRKLLCNEYGSSCQFCIHDDNKEAMCCKVGGSGGWCCENAEWNGKS